jgi:hypothetical protein
MTKGDQSHYSPTVFPIGHRTPWSEEEEINSIFLTHELSSMLSRFTQSTRLKFRRTDIFCSAVCSVAVPSPQGMSHYCTPLHSTVYSTHL